MEELRLKIMVLAGGPDAEREVSLLSGKGVAAGLVEAGHEVLVRDINGQDQAALDEFADWGGDVVFPALHGKWGEGGGLQQILEERGVRFVGCGALAAGLCMDKQQSKLVLDEAGVATPAFCVVKRGQRAATADMAFNEGGGVVVKPISDGSSIDLEICRDKAAYDAARARLHDRHPRLMVERFIDGRELTVGVLVDEVGGYTTLPMIEIVAADGFYDYQAKYIREDTQYLFELGLDANLVEQIKRTALRVHGLLGARHLSRVDVMLDGEGKPWVLEINTLPGFTSHSLLPMAARQAGIEMPMLVDRLVRAACGGFRKRSVAAGG